MSKAMQPANNSDSAGQSIAVTDLEGTAAIMARAIELASVQPGGDLLFDAKAIGEVAAQLDVPADAVASAIAEHAAGATQSEPSLLDKLVGPSQVQSSIRTASKSDSTAKEIVKWLERAHGMNARVRADGVVVATPRKDIMGNLANQVRSAQGLGGLGKIKKIQMAAIDLDETAPGDVPSGMGAACVVADVSDKRTGALAGGAVVGSGAAAVIGAAAMVTATPVALVGLPLAAGLGLLVSRAAHRSTVTSVAEGLDEMMDGVLLGERPPTMMSRFKKRLS